ncbi:hypothetical protein JDV02_009089 [Purpureocillium takamizusanense]|uniref:F-box domain-containing protein n=1 Tax=Purpureocillium takamizusanense TaxID=2060973 RepID=A0A9Q8QRP4_9HYPO|nr:uncharacterized protein JDV02_009089 [Purpureocillium takamizusanense]UNI23257.1 hypothetical protein JDV02_009089 [Purpureocillium takamizusanense]
MLADLPPEILYLVVEWLSERDVGVLVRTNTRLHSLLDERLYRRNVLLFDAFSLHWAVAAGRVGTARKAINAGADVNRGKDGSPDRRPLILAARHGHVGLLELFLAAPGTDVNVTDSTGRGALSWAAVVGLERPLAILLAVDAIEADAGDAAGRTPLWWAAAVAEPSAVALLLFSEKVSVDRPDDSGQTALIAAAAGLGMTGAVDECVEMLLFAGARPDARSLDDRTPLSWAAGLGKLGVFKLVLRALDESGFKAEDGIGGWTTRDWVTAAEKNVMVQLLQAGSPSWSSPQEAHR